MAYQPKDGDGSLFDNDYKQSDNQPDMRGNLLLNGVEYQISAWRKQGQRGEFLSLRVEPKRDRQQQQPPKPQPSQQPSAGPVPDDDSIPF